MSAQKRRLRRWLLVGAVLVILAGGGYWGTRYRLWPAFKAHRLERINQEGRAFLTAHDYANALLTARKGLQASIHNPGAWELAAEAAQAQDLPEAVFYQDSLAREVPTKDNYLKIMRMAVHFDVPEYGLSAAKSVGVAGQSDIEFHQLAAELYRRTGQLIAAKYELQAVTQLDPSDGKAALELAELELASDPNGRDHALRPRIRALSREPAFHDQALILLLTENLRLKRVAGTAELVADLQSSRALNLTAQLAVVRGQLLLGQSDAAARVVALKNANRDDPTAVSALIEFQIETGEAANVAGWVASLAPKVREDLGVQHMVAEALLKVGNPLALSRYLEPLDWRANDFLRQALLAHAYRDQGRSANFESAWRLAVIAVSTDVRKASALLARADEWRWVNERYQVVWKLFNLAPTNESLQAVLSHWERRQGNTVNLNRLFGRVIEVQPNNDDAENNFAYTSLLLDSNITRASLISARLAREKPSNAFYVTTNALAYYKQGDPRAALAHLDTLSAVDRSLPLRMMFRGLFLAAEGQVAPATDLVNGVQLEGMLPEEKHLVSVAIAAISDVDRMNGYRSRLVAFHRGQGADSAASGWLPLVSTDTRLHATADMELADSLYAVPDWKGLGDLLNATEWKDHDYLRLALRGYLLRLQGSPVEGHEQWEQAIALAAADNGHLQNLRSLATFWGWTAERVEALNRLFRNTPGDHALLAELLQYYRAERRTPDLMRVLAGYTVYAPDAVDETVLQAYYGLLLGSNEAQAHVVALRAFQAAPRNLERRMVYCLSLWRQNRSAEAIGLLAGLGSADRSSSVSVPLIKAIILAQVGQSQAARASLAQFDELSALPEEAALARHVEIELANQEKAVKPPVT